MNIFVNEVISITTYCPNTEDNIQHMSCDHMNSNEILSQSQYESSSNIREQQYKDYHTCCDCVCVCVGGGGGGAIY